MSKSARYSTAITLVIILSLPASAQTGCLSTFTVACDPAVSVCQGDGFVNSPPSQGCDYGGVELDIVHCGYSSCPPPTPGTSPHTTIDLTLLDFDTCSLAGETITAAALQTSVTWSHIEPTTPFIVGDYFNWTPFPCAPNYTATSGTSAINNFPTNQVPAHGPLQIPLNPAGVNSFGGHTKIRMTLGDQGPYYSEVDFWSVDSKTGLAPELQVWHTGPKCNITPGPTAPIVLPTPTPTPNCQWNGSTCVIQ